MDVREQVGALDVVPAAVSRTRDRIVSLDVVRGAVMVLMAIDHVRVYSGLPAGGPTPGIFFTRWVTHFCAPAFVFLAGTGAYLQGRKLGDRGALARYLVTRGLLLVLLELTVIRFSWTFNFEYGKFVLAGVIWMLGWCMVLMAPLVWLPLRAIGAFALLVIVFQQGFQFLPAAFPDSLRHAAGWLWEFIYPAGFERWRAVTILYVLVPWLGVMAAGYAFGSIVVREPAARRRFCLAIGLSLIALFLAVGGLTALSGPAPETPTLFLFRLLDQRKYPASQLFLLMTLGPAIALLPTADRAGGRLGHVLSTFGRVPMFYYLLHIPAIHLAALAVTFVREGQVHPEWYASAPFASVPPDHRWSLGLLYLVFALVVAALYPLCRWFDRLKSERPSGWIRYI
jgi:uncharacterized membrane protein